MGLLNKKACTKLSVESAGNRDINQKWVVYQLKFLSKSTIKVSVKPVNASIISNRSTINASALKRNEINFNPINIRKTKEKPLKPAISG